MTQVQMAAQAGVLVDARQAEGAVPGAARRLGTDGASEAVTAEQLWTKYAARLTSVVVRYLRADYWHMPQASSPVCKVLAVRGSNNVKAAQLQATHAETRVCALCMPDALLPYHGVHPEQRLHRALNRLCEVVEQCIVLSMFVGAKCTQPAGEGAGSHGHLRQCQEAHRAQQDGQGPHL